MTREEAAMEFESRLDEIRILHHCPGMRHTHPSFEELLEKSRTHHEREQEMYKMAIAALRQPVAKSVPDDR